jgi:uncharacterized protein YndB with AHSA1/START domain
MVETVQVEVSRHIAAPPLRVFDAWLDPQALGRWLFATPDGQSERVEVDARVGGRFRVDERRGDLVAEHWGTYVEIERPHRLVFDFGTSFGETPTPVTVTIEPDGDGARVTLRHAGVSISWPTRAPMAPPMIAPTAASPWS